MDTEEQSVVRTITFIGSRRAPTADCELIYKIALWHLRNGGKGVSGGAMGPDNSFTRAVRDYLKDNPDADGTTLGYILIPWDGFNDLHHGDFNGVVVHYRRVCPAHEARRIALAIHPAPDLLTSGAINMHSRNIPQVLQLDLNSPVDAVILSAPHEIKSGWAKGGTRTADAIAEGWLIPRYNLQKKGDKERLIEYLRETLAVDADTIIDWFGD